MTVLALSCRYVQAVEDWHEAPAGIRERFLPGTMICSANYATYVGFERFGRPGEDRIVTGLRFSWRQGSRWRAASHFDRVNGTPVRNLRV